MVQGMYNATLDCDKISAWTQEDTEMTGLLLFFQENVCLASGNHLFTFTGAMVVHWYPVYWALCVSVHVCVCVCVCVTYDYEKSFEICV